MVSWESSSFPILKMMKPEINWRVTFLLVLVEGRGLWAERDSIRACGEGVGRLDEVLLFDKAFEGLPKFM